jgi:hypothetical protein
MGIFFFGAIVAYLGMALLGGILLAQHAIQSRLLSMQWFFGVCTTATIGGVLLSRYGLDPKYLHGDYSNMTTVWHGFVGWNTVITAIGIFGSFVIGKQNRFLVGMSSGCVFVALWWFVHILSLTQWR